MRDEPGFPKGLSFPSLSDNKEEGTWHRYVSIQDDCRSASGKDSSRKRTRRRHNIPDNAAPETPSSMKPKLLIVDDDEAIRTQMKWALREDYEIHCAEDRRGGSDVLEANHRAEKLAEQVLTTR